MEEKVFNFKKGAIDYAPEDAKLIKDNKNLKVNNRNNIVDKNSETLYNEYIEGQKMSVLSKFFLPTNVDTQLQHSLGFINDCCLFLKEQCENDRKISISSTEKNAVDRKISSADFSSLIKSSHKKTFLENGREKYFNDINNIYNVYDSVEEIKKIFLSRLSFIFSNFLSEINIGSKILTFDVNDTNPISISQCDSCFKHLSDLSNISDLESDLKFRMISKVYSDRKAHDICNSIKLSSLKKSQYGKIKRNARNKKSFFSCFSNSTLDSIVKTTDNSIESNLFSLLSWCECYADELDDTLNILSKKILSVKSINNLKTE